MKPLLLCAAVLSASAALVSSAEKRSGASAAAEEQREVFLLLRRYLAAQQYHAALGKKYATDPGKLVGKSTKKTPLPWYRIEKSFADAIAKGTPLHGCKFVRLEKDSDGEALGTARHALVAVPAKSGKAGRPCFLAFASRSAKVRGGDIWSAKLEGNAPEALPRKLEKGGWKVCRNAAEAEPVKIGAEQRKKIEKLIAQLGDDSFATRENASAELRKVAALAAPLLKRAAAESKDAEVVSRAQNILRGSTSGSPSETRAVGCCRAYASAQSMYKRNDWDADATLEYAVPFSLLNTEPDGNGNPIQLIDKIFKAAVSPKKPKFGYFFVDMRTIAGTAIDWVNDYALCAIPAKYGGATRNTFIVATNGTVFSRDIGGRPVFDYPANPGVKGWRIAE
jgi:hypothetical protein